MVEIKASTAAPTKMFMLDGLDYPKSSYDIFYAEREQTGGVLDTSLIKVGIVNKYTGQVLVNPRHYSGYSTDGVTPFASWSALMTHLSDVINFNTASGGSGAITQTASSFSNFTAGTNVGDIAYAINSEGTKWLPFTLGGTYYPKGFYQWDGANWVSDRNGIAEALYNLDNAVKNQVVIVKSASQLSGTLDSTKVYFIDGQIDMGTTQIKVPQGGLTIEGHGYDISKLFSSENNYTMFIVDPAGTYSGNLTISGNTIWVNGTGSKIFNLDNAGNFGAIEFNTVNLGDFPVTTPSFGNLANYRQFRCGNFAAIKYTEGFTFDGSWSGIALRDSIILSSVAGSTFLKEGTSFTISDGLISNMNALSLTGTSVWCDFAPSVFINGSLMTLTGFRTRADNAIPNISHLSTSAYFKSCVGIDNTFVGGSWDITTEAQTNITTPQTLVKVAGTTTADLDAWFSHPANNRLQYNGKRIVKVDIVGYVQLESASSESFEIEVRHWDASLGSFVDIRSVPIETALKLLGDRRGGAGIVTQALLEEGDYIELWVKDASATGTADPTMLLESTLTITERQ